MHTTKSCLVLSVTVSLYGIAPDTLQAGSQVERRC